MNKEEIKASVGKQVCVKTITGKVCGRLDFAGENENFPSWGFQLTVGGMPMQNVNPNDVSLKTERPIIKKEVSEEEVLKLAKEAMDRFGTTMEKLSD